MAHKNNAGSSFDDFLKKENIYSECQSVAIKRVLSWQIAEEMKKNAITKTSMAEKRQAQEGL